MTICPAWLVVLLYLTTLLVVPCASAQTGDTLFSVDQMLIGLGIDPNNRQQVIDSLLSADASTRALATEYSGSHNVREALPVLRTLFARHSVTQTDGIEGITSRGTGDRANVLRAAIAMKDTSFQMEFRMEIDSMRAHGNDERSLLMFSHYLMHVHRDPFGFPAIYPLYAESTGDLMNAGGVFISLLEPFLASPYRQEVVDLLLSRGVHSTDDVDRGVALLLLARSGAPQAEALLISAATADTSTIVRTCYAAPALKEMRSSAYLPTLMEMIRTEASSETRELLYRDLLATQSPVAYKYVFDVLENGSDEAAVFFGANLEESYNAFMPDPSLSCVALIDSLRGNAAALISLGWIRDTVVYAQYAAILDVARSAILAGDSVRCARAMTRLQILARLQKQPDGTGGGVTEHGYAYLYYQAQYLLDRLPAPDRPALVLLFNSAGVMLQGASLQYYQGSWRDASPNGDGSFSISTTLTSASLRMTYAYASQTRANVPIGGEPVVFRTIRTSVRLQSSQGTALDTGVVQYYAGAWREFGTTSNGIASGELLPGPYSFRMSYVYGSADKQQDIGTNPAVTFQTVAVAARLQNSSGTLIDQGSVQYYAGAWRDFGSTSGGIATKELLPSTYSFRMTYAFGSNDKQQNVGTNATVVFQTVATTVRLLNSAGVPLDQGTVQYYSGAWRTFGVTAGGIVTKELLPRSYAFRMTHAFIPTDKTQDLASSTTVTFSTVLCTVRAKDSQGRLVDAALASYYAGAWRQIGATVNGEVTKELLPVNLTFRLQTGSTSQDKAQNLSTIPVVEFILQP